MSSLVNLPFGFIPASSPKIQSASYTVPNGIFSLITVYFKSCNGSNSVNSITLNGSTILQTISNISSSSTPGISAISHTANMDQATFSSTPFSGKNSGKLENYSTGNFIYHHNMQTPKKLTFFAKSGDVINGTGNWALIANEFVNANALQSGFKYFNYCPSSTIIASSSYTIPSGKHARALLYFLPQSYAPSAMSNYPSVNTITINGASVVYINNKTAWEYYTYYDDKSATQITYDYLMKNKSFECPEAELFELKAGDVISGSGNWRAIISLYDIPT